MTTQIKGGGKPEAQELLVPPVKARGWLAFRRVEGMPWMAIHPVYSNGTDWARHPAPLHASREDAIRAAQSVSAGSPSPSVIKVFEIELDA